MKPTVLIFADSGIPSEWRDTLESRPFSTQVCYSEAHLQDISTTAIGLILLRVSNNCSDLPGLLGRLRRRANAPLVLIQTRKSPDFAAAARAFAVNDYLREPITPDELVSSIEHCLSEHCGGNGGSCAETDLTGGERLVGGSAAMAEVRRQIARVAGADCNVLITGETGTGKELAAELIHANSSRRGSHFVCVNCAAIPESLLESELFGYEKGAFTGAQTTRPGYLELADGGTLFLDEIGEMSLPAQSKILRAIESKEVQRLGRRAALPVNVRIVCATNRDLEAGVRSGTFRADLFFRLNVGHIHLPPLRERKEDIRELVEHYLAGFSRRLGLQVTGFTDHSWSDLLSYEWPGNVRELKNVVEVSLVRLPFPRMRTAELPDEFHRRLMPIDTPPKESDRLLSALICHNWNKSKAAEELRWSRMTLYRKMVKYQLSSPRDGKTGAA